MQDAVWRENGVEIEWYTEGDSEDGVRMEKGKREETAE